MPLDQNAVLASEPCTRERGLAAAVHIASIPWPLVGPAVAWVAFRERPYVVLHAKKALQEALILKVGLFIAFLASTVYTVSQVFHYVQTDWQGFSWQQFVVRFLVGWVALALLGLVTAVLSLWQAWRAWCGPPVTVTVKV